MKMLIAKQNGTLNFMNDAFTTVCGYIAMQECMSLTVQVGLSCVNVQ